MQRHAYSKGPSLSLEAYTSERICKTLCRYQCSLFAGGQKGYPYTQQLAQLEARSPLTPTCLPAILLDITTPLKAKVWEAELSHHPDTQFSSYVVNGIKNGFRVGFDRQRLLKNYKGNMASALEHPQVVNDYLQQELLLSRMVIIPQGQVPYIHCQISPFGVIPKKSKPGKWRLIVDLSSPTNASVNDGIDKDMCSISYISIDQVSDCILNLGRGTLMAKVDIKSAYRIVPVHPEDRYLLGVQWNDQVVVDKVLPFGLRSAPLIFTAIADALQWIMEKNNVCNIFHYLDDFITLGPPGSTTCQENLEGIVKTCENTGAPLELSKSEGPTARLTFLGMELDTNKLEIRLPAAKLDRLKLLLKKWEVKKAGKKRDLLSLIGYLQHAAKAVRQGRSFVRRLINASTTVHQLDGFLRLNVAARSDIKWWSIFASQWNGTSMLVRGSKDHPVFTVTSDASGTWGCGAYEAELWFQLQWPTSMDDCHISVKEMIPVVIAAAIWGERWVGQSVRFQSDNSAVVALLNSGSSRDEALMHLMRCLVFITAKFNFTVSASHIRGVHNQLADALSRNNHNYFLVNHPQATPRPSPIPIALRDLLIISKPDWLSQHWTNLWSAIFDQP